MLEEDLSAESEETDARIRRLEAERAAMKESIAELKRRTAESRQRTRWLVVQVGSIGVLRVVLGCVLLVLFISRKIKNRLRAVVGRF